MIICLEIDEIGAIKKALQSSGLTDLRETTRIFVKIDFRISGDFRA